MTQRIQELNMIWWKTLTYRTSTVEIATMSDLYEGLESQGYAPEKYQRKDHLHMCTEFVVFDREQLEGILETLQRHQKFSFDQKWVYTRMDQVVYEEMKVTHPSKRLTSKDIETNPYLIALLLGEIWNSDYFDKNIITDEENKEVTLRCYGTQKDSTGFKRKEYSFEEAESLAFRFGRKIERLSSPNNRSYAYFGAEKEIRSRLGLSFEKPYLKIGDKPVYEATSTPKALLKMRELQKRLSQLRGKYLREEKPISEAIIRYQKMIEKGEGNHFPSFKILI